MFPNLQTTTQHSPKQAALIPFVLEMGESEQQRMLEVDFTSCV